MNDVHTDVAALTDNLDKGPFEETNDISKSHKAKRDEGLKGQ
jgi:hypothetical protein